MPLDGFDRLFRAADERRERLRVAAAGGDDPSVIEALKIAADRGWVRPILVGPEGRIRDVAGAGGLTLEDFEIVPAVGRRRRRQQGVVKERQLDGPVRARTAPPAACC